MKYLANQLLTARWPHSLLAAFGALFLLMAAHAQEIDEVVLIVDDLAVTEHEYSVLHFIQTQADTFTQGACYHGLSLNINMDLSPFERIDPCGYAGLKVTQLSSQGISLSEAQIADQLIDCLIDAIY